MAGAPITRTLLRLVVLALALSVFWSAGCNKQIFPFRDPLLLAQRKVARAVDEGAASAELQSEVTTRVRYNPAPCTCPDWEAWLYGRWVRGALRPEPPTSRAPQELRLRVTSEREEGENGWRYPVFELAAPQ